MTTGLSPQLAALGDDLERAVREDLARTADAPPARVRRLGRGGRYAIAGGITAALVGVGVGFAAADGFLERDDPETRLRMSDVQLVDTNPECEKIADDEFSCTIDTPLPSMNGLGWTVGTNDADGYVNGGCRSLNSAATEWTCYLGQKAVDERIIDKDHLGDWGPGPGVG